MQHNANPANQVKNSALILTVWEVKEKTGYAVEVIERMLATGQITGAYRYVTGEWAVPLDSLPNTVLSWYKRQSFAETIKEWDIPVPTYKPKSSTQTSQETSKMPPNPITDGHAKESS